MKKFILVILSVMIAAATLFTACTGSSVDSGVSTGSSADVESDVQSAISSDNGSVTTDDPLSASVDENSVESQISSEDSTDRSVDSSEEASEDSTDSSEETTEDSTEDTSDVVAVVTPVKPDDTSDNVPDNDSSVADVSVAPSPVIDPVESTEDNTSEAEHIHKYKVTVKYATCTEDGYFLYNCSCGDSYTDNKMTAKGHRYWDEYVHPAEPEREGWISDIERQTATRTCRVCAQSETKALADFFIIKESDIDAICDRILELLNEERAKLGAPALSTAPIAHEMAMVRAEQLTTLFSHTMPDGRNGRFIYKDYQYNPEYRGIGEDGKSNCLPFSSSEDIMEGGFSCVNSAYDLALHCLNTFKSGANRTGHWADLTNPEYTGVGVGFAISAYGTFSTADKNGSFSSYNPVHAVYTYELAILTMDKTYG